MEYGCLISPCTDIGVNLYFIKFRLKVYVSNNPYFFKTKLSKIAPPNIYRICRITRIYLMCLIVRLGSSVRAVNKQSNNNKMNDQKKVLEYLISVERLAEEILADRREIVQLDKRRNQNREALRDLKKSSQYKCWVTVGSVLVKHDLKTTESLLEEDMKQLNIDINKLRSDLKIKVNNLRDLEMQPPVPGLLLVPMSQKEKEGLSKAGLLPP